MQAYRKEFRAGQGKPGFTVPVLSKEDILAMKKDWTLSSKARAGKRNFVDLEAADNLASSEFSAAT